MSVPDPDLILRQIAYPGDTPPESNLLRAYLAPRLTMFDRIEFDVRLGEGATPPPGWEQKHQDQFRRGTMLRADCICYEGENAVIVEVKKRGTAGAMGQLLSYRSLYMAAHPQRPEPTMVLVCESVTDELVDVMNAHWISVYVLEPLEPIL